MSPASTCAAVTPAERSARITASRRLVALATSTRPGPLAAGGLVGTVTLSGPAPGLDAARIATASWATRFWLASATWSRASKRAGSSSTTRPAEVALAPSTRTLGRAPTTGAPGRTGVSGQPSSSRSPLMVSAWSPQRSLSSGTPS